MVREPGPPPGVDNGPGCLREGVDGPTSRQGDVGKPHDPAAPSPSPPSIASVVGTPSTTHRSGSSPAARIRSSRSSGAWETATILAPSGLHAIYVKVRLYGSSGKIAVAESPGFHLAKSILRVTDVNALRGRTI